MQGLKITLAIILCLVLLTGTSFVLNGIGLVSFKFFAPKYEDAKREVFENTNSRINGAVQEINKRMIEYNRAESKADKIAIAEYIRSSYPDLEPSKINDAKIRRFFEKCKYGEY